MEGAAQRAGPASGGSRPPAAQLGHRTIRVGTVRNLSEPSCGISLPAFLGCGPARANGIPGFAQAGAALMRTANFDTTIQWIIPIVIATLFILLCSLIKEPARQKFMAILIGGAGSAR